MTTTDPLNEMFPVVNEKDEVVGKTSRKDANSNPYIIHRAVGALILNSKGKLLIQRRSNTKDTFPNYWDISVGGHVEYNENYFSTIQREIAEEIGLNVDPNQLKLLGKILIKLPWENEFWEIYRFDSNEEIKITPNSQEISSTLFVTKERLQKMLNDKTVLWSDKARQIINAYFKLI